MRGSQLFIFSFATLLPNGEPWPATMIPFNSEPCVGLLVPGTRLMRPFAGLMETALAAA
jgi:hypothetical protein